MKIIEPSVELMWSTPQAEKMIELAGRTCYKSEPKIYSDCNKCNGTGKYLETIIENREMIELDCEDCSNRSSKEFIQKILNSGHHSVLEHSSASLKITTDNGIMREITRHRLFSYSIESTRYCNYSGDKFGNEIKFIKPSQIKDNCDNEDAWKQSIRYAECGYLTLINMGVSPQNARSVLPLCTSCQITMTGNFRNWRHFLELRLDNSAHPDMILLAKLICSELKKIAPSVFDEFDCK
jgi:thymidylate synthase (FAD)